MELTGLRRDRNQADQQPMGIMINGFLIPIFQTRKLRSRTHVWKLSETGSEARSVWLWSPHVLSNLLSFYGAFVLAVIAKEQVCGVCAFPVRQPILIWGGKMNLALVNATLLIDLGKCLAASIHLPKGNVIRPCIILLLSLCSEYATFPQLTTSSMSYGNKQTHGIDTRSRHVFLQTM